MDKMKGVAKGGWHPPGKQGGTESWRGDFKGINQMAGWIGKGKDTGGRQESRDHVARPITTLKDPTTFGPPPRKVDYNSGSASPRATTPTTAVLGAPSTAEEDHVKDVRLQREATEEQEPQKPRPPPVPFRADATRLSTSNYPTPPVRRLEQEAPPRTSTASPYLKPKPKPSLPPRLPPRQNSHPTALALSPPPPYRPSSSVATPQKDYLDQGALDRLGSVGVSVPGLGIGKRDEPENPWQGQTSTSTETAVPGTQSRGPQLSELQSRFSQMSASSPTSGQPAQGTSLAQKQAVFKTARSFRNDPSSVTLADAKGATSTVNNFRERHGEQVATGWRGASNLNMKYGLTDKFNGYASNGTDQPVTEPPPVSPGYELPHSSSGIKKNAPPPPPKKAFLVQDPAASPPPIPYASRPK